MLRLAELKESLRGEANLADPFLAKDQESWELAWMVAAASGKSGVSVSPSEILRLPLYQVFSLQQSALAAAKD